MVGFYHTLSFLSPIRVGRPVISIILKELRSFEKLFNPLCPVIKRGICDINLRSTCKAWMKGLPRIERQKACQNILLNKNIVYKNIQAQNRPIFKNI